MVAVIKHGIILEKTDHGFENEGVFNPGIFQDENTVHMFYRAMRTGNFSSIGYCKLAGPLTIVERNKEPVFYSSNSCEFQGVEDPRITKIEDTLDYATTHELYHPLFKDFLEKFGYYDIFLIEAGTGNIVYSVFKEVDFGTSLKNGAFANSNLSKVYESAIGSNENSFVTLVDYEPYRASYNAPAAFMASPIFDEDVCIGVLVFQMPIEEINNIMTNR